jgi:lipopolysaccharide/colanic/teichoic acid biosynthesis glycosyltransferase
MLVIAIAVRLDLGSPVLFRQRRPGRRGEPFTILKFRTMRDAPTGTTAAVDDPDRIEDRDRTTAIGAFLRRTSLDELPELWNVLRGDMSLVGPRPLLMEYLPLYTAEQARRHEVRPGVTGLAQVNGRDRLRWDERFRLDVWYVDNRSLGLDARILARTVRLVLSKEGRATTEGPDYIFRGATADPDQAAAVPGPADDQATTP